MISFAIAVRVFDGEAPYLQSFIDHHCRLGVDAFYPVIAPGGAPLCREIFARNGIAFHESDGQRISSVQNLIREDYVAVIDADEYLHPDLFSFLGEEKVRLISGSTPRYWRGGRTSSPPLISSNLFFQPRRR